jgi:threonyl-tRNA synthetase
MIRVALDDKVVEIEKGKLISDLLTGHKYFAAKVNNELRDLNAEITEDSEIKLIDFSSEEGKKIYWHSSSHVMAMAVKNLFPEAKLAIGPAIDQGFYYDFDTKQPLSPEDLARIEKKMQKIIDADMPFKRTVMKKEAAIELFEKNNESYKVQLIKELEADEISLYYNGDFVDLCRGPHVPSTGFIRAFKLLSLA